MKDCYRNILLEYNDLYGDVTMLEKAKKLTINPRCQAAIARLEEVYEVLKLYGYEKYVSFDLGMVNHFDYYTGIIFKAYTYGTGDAIVAGGRYDKLLSQFGKDSAAIGFAVYMDQLLMAMSSQKMEGDTDYAYEVLIYDTELRKTALQLATGLREKGIKTELIPKKENISIDEYVEFKKEDGAINVTYVSKDGVKEL